MDNSSRSEWHVGGTRAPCKQARDGSPSVVGQQRAIDVVPLRARGSNAGRSKGQIAISFRETDRHSGTQWHDGPCESIRDHWRTR